MSKPEKSKTASQITKAKMAANSKVIQSAKKPAAKATPPAKDGGKLEVIPPVKTIAPAKGDVGEIMQKCLEISPDGRYVTGIKVGTTTGEYVAMFDNCRGIGESWQFFFGSLIFHGRTMKEFGGDERFEEAMAKCGRGIDSCKSYEIVFRNTPIKYIKQGLAFTVARQTVKIRNPEQKALLLDKIIAADKSGESMTVKEVAAEAHKLVPKKKTAAQKPREYTELTADQESMLRDYTVVIESAQKMSADMSFLRDAKPAVTAKVRGMLAEIAAFSAKLEK